jgi:2-dehydropantoate 2-reductase
VDGLDVTVPGDRFRRASGPEALAGADLVLVTVKSMATGEAAAAIAAHAPAGTVVVSFQNGVSNPDVLRAALPGRRCWPGWFRSTWRSGGRRIFIGGLPGA